MALTVGFSRNISIIKVMRINITGASAEVIRCRINKGHGVSGNRSATKIPRKVEGEVTLSNTWRRKVVAEVAGVGYTCNEIKSLALHISD